MPGTRQAGQEPLQIEAAWRGYRLAAFPDHGWRIEGAMLRALPGRGTSLVSRERFADFDLSLEWRLPAGGNSGILYRVTEQDDAPWQSGPEMQLLDNAGHPDGRVAETSCGALYGVYAPQNAPACPIGVFNTARIRVRGTRVEHWLNGARVIACDLASEDFRARAARGKFRNYPRFARAVSGHIVLQHHGSEVTFSNISIEPA